MNENCQKWHQQVQNLRAKHAEFMQTYKEALEFAEQNPKIRETSFTRCRELFNEIKPLVFELRDSLPRLTKEQKAQLTTLKDRFNHNPDLHKEILEPKNKKLNPDKVWRDVEKRLKNNPKLIDSLIKMEQTGGEPDLIWYDKEKDQYIFVDCSAESPKGRRMICYDREGQELAMKNGNKPEGNAIDMAKAMGIEVLTEAEYQELQKLGKFDFNTMSWLKTPIDIRKIGRALYGSRDCDHDNVYVGQYDADIRVAYGAFRGSLRV